MRTKLTAVLSLIVALFAAAAPAETWTAWRNSLAPAGDPGPELMLAAEGQARYVIVIPTEATTQEKKAAEDLGQWLNEITGATFKIVPDAEPPHDREISVGKTSRVDAALIPSANEDLGNEGYAIAAAGEKLFLLGGRIRGPINAVYALLEEDLGCRWYAGSTATLPHLPTLIFRPVPRRFMPALEIRDPFYQVAFDAVWSLRNRTNAPSAAIPEEYGGHMDYALFVHTFNILLPPAQYFAEHPEYFMLDAKGMRIDRQLCTTNPDTIRIVTESVLRILDENPHSEIISVSKNDGGGTCLCERCKAIDDAEGTNMGALLYLVNQVAEAVAAKHPNVIVSTLAYLETVKPPKTMRPRSNVAIRLCTDNCMWSCPFTPAREISAFYDAMTSWSAIHDRIHIWDYCVNFSHYTAPMPNLDVIADNIRFFLANHAKGIMEQGAYQSPGAERDLMRAWIFAKLMWDPSRDLRTLEQDFIWGYFAAAAPAIAEYNALLLKTARDNAESMRAPDGGIRYAMDAPFLSRDFLDQASSIYDRAEQLATDDETLRRVQRDRLPIYYVFLCRGPEFTGPAYGKLLDKFEVIARREGLTHIYEGPPDVEQKIKGWREAWKKAQP